MADVLILCVIPMVLLATYLAQAHMRGLGEMSYLVPVYVGIVVLFMAWMIQKLSKAGERIDNLRAGYDTDLAVARNSTS